MVVLQNVEQNKEEEKGTLRNKHYSFWVAFYLFLFRLAALVYFSATSNIMSDVKPISISLQYLLSLCMLLRKVTKIFLPVCSPVLLSFR